MGDENRGRFIVFEGLDGCGKSTQLRWLSERLTAQGLTHIVTREPSDGNPVGQLTRAALRRDAGRLTNETMALLFAADRWQHAEGEITPALRAGVHVLCDRYYYSNFAYQGGETPFERLAAYNARSMAERPPDLTIFIDVPPEECLRRIRAGRNDTELYENLHALAAARMRFKEAFARFGAAENIVDINAARLSEAETAEQIWRLVRTVFLRTSSSTLRPRNTPTAR